MARPPKQVGIREFRENLSTILLKSDEPVAITRHGDTVGHYFPMHRKRTPSEREVFRESAAKFQEMLDEKDVTEEEIQKDIQDFKRWRRSQNK